MNNEHKKDLELFELDESSSMSELKHAYRELCKVWHPDRFKDDSELAEKANQKLIELNAAYERLFFYLSNRKFNSSDERVEPENHKQDFKESINSKKKIYDGNSAMHRFFNLLFQFTVYGSICVLLFITFALGMSKSPKPYGWETAYGFLYLLVLISPFILLICYRVLVYVFFGNSISFNFKWFWFQCLNPTFVFLLLLLVGYITSSSIRSKSESIRNEILSTSNDSDNSEQIESSRIRAEKMRGSAYQIIEGADKLTAELSISAAIKAYENALKILTNLKKENPKYDGRNIGFRINSLTRKIEILKRNPPTLSIWDAVISRDLSGIDKNINVGVSVNSKRNGETPLHLAANKEQLDVVKRLISLGADINSLNQAKNTPLHLAARRDNVDICRFLIKRGALKSIRNKSGRTPAMEAVFFSKKNAYTEIKKTN